jgi:hypothetical protein
MRCICTSSWRAPSRRGSQRAEIRHRSATPTQSASRGAQSRLREGSIRHQAEAQLRRALELDDFTLTPPVRYLRERREQTVVAGLPLRVALRRRNLVGNDGDRILVDVRWPRVLAHQSWITAAPFSAISMIGTRLEPRIGATSSISHGQTGSPAHWRRPVPPTRRLQRKGGRRDAGEAWPFNHVPEVLCGGRSNGRTAARAFNLRRRTRRQVHFAQGRAGSATQRFRATHSRIRPVEVPRSSGTAGKGA